MTNESTKKTRMFFVDNLRVFLTIMVILYHLALAYGAYGHFVYVEAGTHRAGYHPAYAVHRRERARNFMGFLFLIAGYFTPGSYDRKGAGRVSEGPGWCGWASPWS